MRPRSPGRLGRALALCAALAGAAAAPARGGGAPQRIAPRAGRLHPDVPLPPSLSADCGTLAFTARGDLYVHDRLRGESLLASLATDGTPADRLSSLPSLSHDARVVAFTSFARNLGPPPSPSHAGVFVRDLATGVTWRASRAWDGGPVDGSSSLPALSGDGSVVAFESAAGNLVRGDRNGVRDVFVHELRTRRSERVSVSSRGDEADAPSGTATVDRDGSVVVFASEATNLVPRDGNGAWDVFVRDRVRGTTARVSAAPDGRDAHGPSDQPDVDARGGRVVFASDAANLVAGDRNEARDVFLWDRATARVRRVSVAGDGGEADGDSDLPSISGDGRLVAFVSRATNLVPGDRNGVADVFVRDLSAGTTRRVGVPPDGSEADDESGSMGPLLSADGSCVAFVSFASNLVPDDPNRGEDLFVVELGPPGGRGGP